MWDNADIGLDEISTTEANFFLSKNCTFSYVEVALLNTRNSFYKLYSNFYLRKLYFELYVNW